MAITAAFLAGQRMISEYIAHSLPGNGPVELSLLPAIAWAISCGIAAAAFTLAVFTIWWRFQGFEALGQPGQWLPLPAILTPLVWSLSYFTFIAGVVKRNASLEWTWYYGKIPVAIASFVLELGMHVLPAVTFVCCAILDCGHAPVAVLPFRISGPARGSSRRIGSSTASGFCHHTQW